MTKRDRASLAQLLTEVAERLESAPDRASGEARKSLGVDVLNSPHGAYAMAVFRETTLEHSCRDSATAIRIYVAEYLTPKTTNPRGRR